MLLALCTADLHTASPTVADACEEAGRGARPLSGEPAGASGGDTPPDPQSEPPPQPDASATGAQPPPSDASTKRLTSVPEALHISPLRFNPAGDVVDVMGRRLTAENYANLTGDHDLLDRVSSRRKADKLASTLWIIGGSVTGGVGIISSALATRDGYQMTTSTYTSFGIVAVGFSALGVGIGGGIIARRWHEDPGYWVDEATLRAAVEKHNASLAQGAAEPARAAPATLVLQPLVGPVMGVQGTF